MQNSMNYMNTASNLTYKISMKSLVLAVYQIISQLTINEKYYTSPKLYIEILYNKFDIRFILLIKVCIFPCIQTLYKPLRR